MGQYCPKRLSRLPVTRIPGCSQGIGEIGIRRRLLEYIPWLWDIYGRWLEKVGCNRMEAGAINTKRSDTMKRSVQMKNAGIPKAGTIKAFRPRNPHWRETHVTKSDGGRVYTIQPPALVIHPVRRRRRERHEYGRMWAEWVRWGDAAIARSWRLEHDRPE